MKKIFTLFAVALFACCAYAQEQPCPTKMELTPLAETQPADNVELELGIVYNNSENLNGFNFEFAKPEGASWKRAQGISYFTAKGYTRYIFERMNVDGLTVDDLSDAELDELIVDMLDCNSSVKAEGKLHNDVLVVIEILKSNSCRFFPSHAGKVGKAKIDMSALEDGEYQIVAEAVPETGSMTYTGGPEGNRAWTIDEDLVLTLTKTGDEVTTGINIIEAVKNVTNVTYYNLQGVESATPFDGVSIMVTTYDDGSKKAVKVLK